MEVNDERLRAGERPLLEIDVIPSPEAEWRKTRSRYVVLGWTAKLVVVALLLAVVLVTLAAELTL
jgi:hypothetical protein